MSPQVIYPELKLHCTLGICLNLFPFCMKELACNPFFCVSMKIKFVFEIYSHTNLPVLYIDTVKMENTLTTKLYKINKSLL